MGTMIFLALVVLAIVQFIQLKRKKSKFQFSEQQAKINELMTALKNGYTNHTDKQGRTILMIACDENEVHSKKELCFFDVIKESVKRGVKVNAHALKDGRTALSFAAAKPYNKDVVEYLLKSGASTLEKDHRGRNSLFYAAETSDHKTFSALVDQSHTLNETDLDGNTALMAASKYLNLVTMRLLIDRGVNVLHRNVDGHSAYDIASSNKHKYIKSSGNSARPDEYGKHNHAINEMVRELHCLENNKTFKPQKYVPPSRPMLGEDPGE